MRARQRLLDMIFTEIAKHYDMIFVGDNLFVDLGRNKFLQATTFDHCESFVAIGLTVQIHHKDNGVLFEQTFSFEEFGIYAVYNLNIPCWRNPGLSKEKIELSEEDLDRIRKPLRSFIRMWLSK